MGVFGGPTAKAASLNRGADDHRAYPIRQRVAFGRVADKVGVETAIIVLVVIGANSMGARCQTRRIFLAIGFMSFVFVDSHRGGSVMAEEARAMSVAPIFPSSRRRPWFYSVIYRPLRCRVRSAFQCKPARAVLFRASSSPPLRRSAKPLSAVSPSTSRASAWSSRR